MADQRSSRALAATGAPTRPEDGSRCRYIGLVHFSLKVGRYVDEFQVGLPKGDRFEALPFDDWPHWAIKRHGPEGGLHTIVGANRLAWGAGSAFMG